METSRKELWHAEVQLQNNPVPADFQFFSLLRLVGRGMDCFQIVWVMC